MAWACPEPVEWDTLKFWNSPSNQKAAGDWEVAGGFSSSIVH
jgi:hypothetical protein